MNFFMENKKPYFNLIYIDACHDGRCVLSDAILSFKSLKVDGYIVFDDYGWKKTKHDYERPKIAVDAFLNNQIKFNQIYTLIEKTLSNHKPKDDPDIHQIIDSFNWATAEGYKLAEEL